MRFFSQLLKLPIAALSYGMEMFVRTVQGLQKIADQSIDIVVSGTSQLFGGAPDVATDLTTAAIPSDSVPPVAKRDETKDKEEKRMPDTNLTDDMLKLVRFKILFVKRDYEHAFPEQEELVKENTTANAFAGWKIAEFIQHLGDQKTVIPRKWTEKGYPGKEFRDGDKLIGFPDGDKKYLRVYFEVLDRYVREKLEYEEDHLQVLREIRDRMPGSSSSGGSSSGSKSSQGWTSGGNK